MLHFANDVMLCHMTMMQRIRMNLNNVYCDLNLKLVAKMFHSNFLNTFLIKIGFVFLSVKRSSGIYFFAAVTWFCTHSSSSCFPFN